MAGRRVLVVEDSEVAAQTLVDVLTRGGYEVRRVGTGAGAVKLAEAWGPSIVVVDRRLPDTDGLVLAGQIRKLPSGAQVRIVMVSGDPLPARRPKSLDAFVLKPASIRSLLAAVRGS